jgi:hypothetical protein
VTERKPPDASVGSWVEFQIRRAQARGEFDNLRGHGKPIADLHEPHDELWWIKRKLRDENVSSVPPAIALRRDVEVARERIAAARTETEVRRIVEDLNGRIRRVNRTTTAGPATGVMPLDVEAIVAGWRDDEAASRRVGWPDDEAGLRPS